MFFLLIGIVQKNAVIMVGEILRRMLWLPAVQPSNFWRLALSIVHLRSRNETHPF